MTVYEVLCLLNPNDTVNIVDSRDSSSLYSKFSYSGLVSKIPFRPDVFNHSVYQISSDNGVSIFFNERGLATGVRIFDVLCVLKTSQRILIRSEFAERFSGLVSELSFDSELLSLRVQKLESLNNVVVMEYFVPNESRYDTFRVL